MYLISKTVIILEGEIYLVFVLLNNTARENFSEKIIEKRKLSNILWRKIRAKYYKCF